MTVTIIVMVMVLVAIEDTSNIPCQHIDGLYEKDGRS